MGLFDNGWPANERGIMRMGVPIAAALVAAFGSSPPAIAQGVAAQSKLELEEVTVTARKREESLLEVPIAITAVSEEAIAAYNIRDLNDLQRVTPGFSMSETLGFRRARDTFTLVVRGLNIGNSSTLSSAATIFMDGAPLVGGRPSSFHDVERIEVLKGPQTAYFGRSTSVARSTSSQGILVTNGEGRSPVNWGGLAPPMRCFQSKAPSSTTSCRSVPPPGIW